MHDQSSSSLFSILNHGHGDTQNAASLKICGERERERERWRVRRPIRRDHSSTAQTNWPKGASYTTADCPTASPATYPEAYYTTMVMESTRLWEEDESDIGFKVYFKTNHLDMDSSEDNSLRSVIANCSSPGSSPTSCSTPTIVRIWESKSYRIIWFVC
ncbi:FAD-dependent oxidoreductase family protein [Actinidia rufa]|uniref:FAD-dependent oxidoreductase family protein n=1 Tax=Actinidia rufa TaxID=165716 RepID=A0A7J0DX84_9ERIC|nr:FAD-dependent oxidoreductase family protein [Actinidia rufa]